MAQKFLSQAPINMPFSYSLKTVTVLACLTLSLSKVKDTAEIDTTRDLTDYSIDDSFSPSQHSRYRYQLIKPPQLLALVAKESLIYASLDSIRKNTWMDPAWNTSHLLSSISEYLVDYEKSSLRFFEKHKKKNGGDDDDFVKVVSSHMLTVLLTVRRFTNYIQSWLTDYDTNQMTNLERSLVHAIKTTYRHRDGPKRYDFHLLHFVIIMTHFQLDLKAKDIASGKIGDSVTGIELNAVESMDIALQALASRMYPIAIEWLQLIVEKISKGADKTVHLDLAHQWLQFATDQHDEHWKPKDDENLDETFFVSPLNDSSSHNKAARLKWNKQAECEEQLKSREVHLVNNLPYYSHWNLCNGATAPEVEKSKLFCWYEREIHPTFKIGPFKAEFHSMSPRMEVVQYYDLISSHKLEKLRHSVRHEYESATYFAGGHKPICGLATAPKTIKDPVISEIETIVGRMTGLKVSEEDFLDSQESVVGGYIPGGFLFVHPDGSVPTEEITGVRSTSHLIATVMLYLEAPEHGGQTTFPYPMVAIQPTKGSAVINFNLLSSGEGDIEGCHGACPVISGQKCLWIKDITFTNQYNLKCDMKRDARMEVLVNGKSKLGKNKEGK